MQPRFALGSVGMRGRRDAALGGLITTERRQMPGPPGSAGLRQTGRHDEVSGGRRTRLDPRRRPRTRSEVDGLPPEVAALVSRSRGLDPSRVPRRGRSGLSARVSAKGRVF